MLKQVHKILSVKFYATIFPHLASQTMTITCITTDIFGGHFHVDITFIGSMLYIVSMFYQ